jgi:MFS family permease
MRSMPPDGAAATSGPGPTVASASAWAPLANRLFAVLFVAQFVSNVGTWMQMVGAQWLMGTLGGGPTLVALVAAATSLPVALLAVPSGALADLVDRRSVLLAGQAAAFVVAGTLALVTATERVTPSTLLLLTALLGAAGAVVGPAWLALQPEIVGREQIPAASALAAVNINLSRAVGPALGGAVVALAGPAWVFALNALSFVAILVVLVAWRPVTVTSPYARERLVAAVGLAARYVRNAPVVRRVLLRALLFVLPASALWALLPVVARDGLGLGSGGYGLLLGAIGLGAVVGALLLPLLRARLGPRALLVASHLLFALVVAALGVIERAWAAGLVLAFAGVAWTTTLATLSATMQTVLPSWTRARVTAFYLVVFQGAQAAGAVLWGLLAGQAGTGSALIAAGVVLVASAASLAVLPLRTGAHLDPTPAVIWPEPMLGLDEVDASGPVVVTVEYRVPPANEPQFVLLMQRLRRSRGRTGARRWLLTRDADDPTLWVELFVVGDWTDHLRQHQVRQTETDRALEQVTHALCDGPPRVRHLVTPSDG